MSRLKVFISWSGDRSRKIAEAINEWLPLVIQYVDPFLSSDIEKGANWAREIDDALEGTKFGIVCLTPENLDSVWIHYEVGCLAKTKDALVWTLLNKLEPTDVKQPLGRFQHTSATKDDVLKLVASVNKRLEQISETPLPDGRLHASFEKHWPDLEARLRVINEVHEAADSNLDQSSNPPKRSDRDILEEILELLRSRGQTTESEEIRASNRVWSLGGLATRPILPGAVTPYLFPKVVSKIVLRTTAPVSESIWERVEELIRKFCIERERGVFFRYSRRDSEAAGFDTLEAEFVRYLTVDGSEILKESLLENFNMVLQSIDFYVTDKVEGTAPTLKNVFSRVSMS
jgi:hypothetical protein